MPNRKIIVIGGSAGGGKVVRQILLALPADLEAAIFVTIHRGLIGGVDYLPSSLERIGTLPVGLASDGDIIETGRVYVAPSQGNLLVERYAIRIERSVASRSRESVDAMFRSAAMSHLDSVIGVLLSGMLSDGTAGFWQIRKRGGVTIAQDPKEAQYASMPQSAMKEVPVDYCLPASGIALKLRELVRSSAPPPVFKKGRIMIVEDEWLIASDLETQLNDLGYEVVANVVSGEEALRSAERTAPDVVIMDVHLSGSMRGTDAAMHLREQFQIPSIFLTAYNDLETLTLAQRSRPYAFVAKPYRATELNVAIQLALSARASGLSG